MSDDSGVRAYPPTAPTRVTREAVDDFAVALGGTGGGPVPHTFAIRVAQPAWQQLFDDAELGLSLARTIHAEQIFIAHRDIQVGDVLTAVLRLDKLRRRAGSAHVKVSVDILDDAGVLVVEGKSTFLSQEDA